jgi:hypothetical protein
MLKQTVVENKMLTVMYISEKSFNQTVFKEGGIEVVMAVGEKKNKINYKYPSRPSFSYYFISLVISLLVDVKTKC